MHQHDFINRLLRHRALGLLGLSGNHGREVWKTLGKFYGYRSTLAHGDPLPIPNPHEFHNEMWSFEGIVRDVLRIALVEIPAAPEARRAKLNQLANVSDTDRLDRISQLATGLQDAALRDQILGFCRPKAANIPAQAAQESTYGRGVVQRLAASVSCFLVGLAFRLTAAGAAGQEEEGPPDHRCSRNPAFLVARSSHRILRSGRLRTPPQHAARVVSVRFHPVTPAIPRPHDSVQRFGESGSPLGLGQEAPAS